MLSRGLVTILPAALTLWLLVTFAQFVDAYLASPLHSAIYGGLEGNGVGWSVLELFGIDPYDRAYLDPHGLPVELTDMALREGPGSATFLAELQNWRLEREGFLRELKALAIDPAKLRKATRAAVPPWMGILASLLLILVLGHFAGGFFGRRFIGAVERRVASVPLIRQVYPYTKQLVEFFLSDDRLEFDTVVLAPYPCEGAWTLGFVTGNGLKSLNDAQGGRYVSVFIPTSPMPMTGFTVFIEAARLIPLEISVDEALRVAVSAGVLVPGAEAVSQAGPSEDGSEPALRRAPHAPRDCGERRRPRGPAREAS